MRCRVVSGSASRWVVPSFATRRCSSSTSRSPRGIPLLRSHEDRLIRAHGCHPVEYKWILQGPYPHLPEAVAVPRDTEEVSFVLRQCHDRGIGVIPYGGGSGMVACTVARNREVVVDTKKLRKADFNSTNMAVSAGAGVSGSELEESANRRGFTIGHYPQSYQSATLGGMVATRATGTFSTRYGKMDDIVCGLEVVLANGEVFRSHPAPARSTGPELCEVFLGSEGAYGIVTEVTVKLHPIPEKRHFECWTFPETTDGLVAIRSFVQAGLRPAVVRLYDAEESESRIRALGLERGHSLLILGYEGLRSMVDLEIEEVGERCRNHNGVAHGTEGGEAWFDSRFSTKGMLDYAVLPGATADAIEVAAPWDCIEAVWRGMKAAVEPICDHVHCHFSHVYHAGASVYVIFHATSGGDAHDGEALYWRCLERAMEASLANGGNISHHHGVGTAKARYMAREHGETGLEIMRGIKRCVDPNGILNRGVLGL